MEDDILEHYGKFVGFLGKALGPDYEIVLYDLTRNSPYIKAIANNNISGSKEGDGLTDIAENALEVGKYKKSDCLINYSGAKLKKNVLRSSTMFIKDKNNNLIGMLCINFDDSRFEALSDEILQLCHPNELINEDINYDLENIKPKEKEDKMESIGETVQNVLIEILHKNIPIDRLTQEERINIVDVLNQKGIFMIKGAVSEVAAKLKCSEPTIYRYLSMLNKGKRN